MKYIKKYESLNLHEPKIGDYVIVNIDTDYTEIKNYLSDKIGIIKEMGEWRAEDYIIEFEEYFPENFWEFLEITSNSKIMTIYKKEIKYWSDNKQELQKLLFLNKYNL